MDDILTKLEHIAGALNALNFSSDRGALMEAAERWLPDFAIVDGDVHPVDAAGSPRTRLDVGNVPRPETAAEYIRERCNAGDPRRWRLEAV